MGKEDLKLFSKGKFSHIDNEIIAEGSPLRAEDVLWALGYRFAIEIDPDV